MNAEHRLREQSPHLGAGVAAELRRSPVDSDCPESPTYSSQLHHSQLELERRQLLEELRKAREELQHYRTLSENLPSIYFTLDLTGAICSLSPFAGQRLGYTPEDLIAQPFISLIHPEHIADFAVVEQSTEASSSEDATAPDNPFLKNLLTHNWEGQLKAADGTGVWIRTNVRLLPELSSQEEEAKSGVRGASTQSCRAPQIQRTIYPALNPQSPVPLPTELSDSKSSILNPVFLVSCEEISEHKEAQQALEEQRQFVSQVLEATDVLVRNFVSTVLDTTNSLVLVLDPHGQIVSCNRACEIATGYSFEQISNRHIWDWFGSSEEMESFKALMAELESGKFPVQHENSWVARDGKCRVITWSIAAIFEKNSAVLKYIICTGIDITERRQAEEALRLSEERLRTEYKSIPIPTFTWQRVAEDFILIDYNDAAAEITKGYVGQLLGKPVTYMYPDMPEVRKELSRCFTQKTTVKGEMLYRFPSTIALKHFAVTYVFVAPDMVMVHTEDITERKQLVAALKQQAERERLIGRIQARIRQSLKLDEILKTAVGEVRGFLHAERVAIYQREKNPGAGTLAGGFVVESVVSSFSSVVGMSSEATSFVEQYGRDLRQGEVCAIADTYTAHLESNAAIKMQAAEIRAHLQVPIWVRERDTVESEHVTEGGTQKTRKAEIKLWGWLCVHHCSGSRHWQQVEVDFLQKLSVELAIAIQQAQLYQQLQQANRELHRLATLDELTGVANRRHFEAYLNQEWRRSIRERLPLSLILCDIDYFKLYNDTYGHQAGDHTLQQVAHAIRGSIRRPADLAARYGGEEFAVILPNTSTSGAFYVAEAIRKNVKSLAIAHHASPQSSIVTISVGVATIIPSAETTPTMLIAVADEALYQAKKLGRDTCTQACLV